ncbi:MAG: plastocyanin/azurin family copper-binding protein [Chloroflexota bacterium]
MQLPAAVPRYTVARLRALVATALVLGLLLSVSFAGTAQAATTLNAGVGVGAGTVAGNVYVPGDMTILVGDSVKWTIESDEPHSVTFGNGPAGVPPPNWPAAGFTGTVPPPPATASLTGTYDGTGFLNTELLFNGSTATVTFTAAGTFAFICQIHPGMAGTVNVVTSGATTTQAEADAKATLTRDAILGAVAGLEASTTAQVSETERSDGTSLWNIFTNSAQDPAPQPGGGTGFLEVMRFVPPTLDIEAGDTVKWNAALPHTVTFPAAGQDPMTIDPFTTPATTNAVYDGTSLYNSALMAAGPGSASSYELTFPAAGTFNYVCALHQFLGQTGAIVVSAAPVITPPPTDHEKLAAPPPTELPWLVLGLLAALSVMVATGTLALRRR